MFLVLRERPGLEGAGCGEPHIRSLAYGVIGCKRGGRKKLGVRDAGARIGVGLVERRGGVGGVGLKGAQRREGAKAGRVDVARVLTARCAVAVDLTRRTLDLVEQRR